MRKLLGCITFFCLVGVSIFLFARFSRLAFADQTCDSFTDPAQKSQCEAKNEQIAQIEAQIKIYEQKLEETKQKESSIQQNIDYLDNQIYLSKLRIAESEVIIEKRQQDIENLTNNIIILEDSLDKNTKLFLKRINLSYRQGGLKPYMVFFGSGSFYEKVNKYKYLQTVQTADRKFLFKIQETKNSYNNQKKLVEMEKLALEKEKLVLEQRKQVLASQMSEKETLLSQTQSEEKVLSAQIEDLRAQRKNLLGGVSSVITSYSCQTWTEDDNYFNQADCRWGNVVIGNANYADDSFMWKYGCAVTAVAMVLKKNGSNVNPQTIAQNSDFFVKSGGYQTDLIVWNSVASAYGKSVRYLSNWGEVDQKLTEGKWVIVHVMVGGYGWGHYVVLKSKEGSDYKMHDPYFGNNLMFYSRYSGADQMMVYE